MMNINKIEKPKDQYLKVDRVDSGGSPRGIFSVVDVDIVVNIW